MYIEVKFWTHDSFVSLCFLNLENETFLNIISIINSEQLVWKIALLANFLDSSGMNDLSMAHDNSAWFSII